MLLCPGPSTWLILKTQSVSQDWPQSFSKCARQRTAWYGSLSSGSFSSMHPMNPPLLNSCSTTPLRLLRMNHWLCFFRRITARYSHQQDRHFFSPFSTTSFTQTQHCRCTIVSSHPSRSVARLFSSRNIWMYRINFSGSGPCRSCSAVCSSPTARRSLPKRPLRS